MTLSSPPRTLPQFGRLIGATLLGTILVVAGLLTAYLTVATSFVATLVPTDAAGGRVALGLGVWSFALVAGGGLLVAGTSHLALMLALLRHGRPAGGLVNRSVASMAEVAVASGVVLDGRAIPELVIGPFGAAVVQALPPAGRVRHGPAGWEVRTDDGWQPMADPLESAMRDADRVRRWLGMADIDFIVRVYAAVVTSDRSLQRSPTCAVISVDQIPAWIGSLPQQRTLTAGRRDRLLAIALGMTGDAARPAGRSW
jgi:hypothetical protein